MRNNAIICLGAGNAQFPMVKAAKEAGYAVVAIDRNRDSPAFDMANERIVESTYDSVEIIEALKKVQQRYHYVGLLARASGPALITAAAIAEYFSLPGLTKDVVPLVTEKSRLREFCHQHDILAPKGKRAEVVSDFQSDLRKPLIVKPDLPLIGKKDVRIVWKECYLAQAIERAANTSGNNLVEVEEYIEGIDISVLCLIKNGTLKILHIWDELVGVGQQDDIKAVGLSFPSVIEGDSAEGSIINAIEKFALCFKAVNSLLIFSFRVDFQGNPFLIEVHGDLGGDLIAEALFPAAFPWFDFFSTAVDVALDREIPPMGGERISTCLIYGADQIVRIPAGAMEGCRHSLYFQEGALAKNFDRLDYLIKNSNFVLTKGPAHQQWMKGRCVATKDS